MIGLEYILEEQYILAILEDIMLAIAQLNCIVYLFMLNEPVLFRNNNEQNDLKICCRAVPPFFVTIFFFTLLYVSLINQLIFFVNCFTVVYIAKMLYVLFVLLLYRMCVV